MLLPVLSHRIPGDGKALNLEKGEDVSQALYGDGSDGDLVVSSDVSDLGGIFFNNLTIESGFTARTNGNPIFVRGTLRIESGATLIGLQNNGLIDQLDGIGSSGGGGLAANRHLFSTAEQQNGGDGQTGSGSAGDGSPTRTAGGSGGDGGDGSSGTGGAGGASGLQTDLTENVRSLGGSAHVSMQHMGFSGQHAMRTGSGGGGGGGDGTNPGGGGGAGGYPIAIAARHVINEGTIDCRGGNGAAGTGGNSGGGGGGGGGFYHIICDTYSGNLPDVSGGSGGAGVGTGTAGQPGSDGDGVILRNR